MRAHPTVATAGALFGLAAASTALHAGLVGLVHGPFVFMDELGYERMAQSFAHSGHFSVFGKAGLAYSPLYPIVLSPIDRLTSSAQSAYEWAKVENAVLISLSVFPIYAIARSVLPRGRAVGVAALSLIAPLMLYSGFEMTENLAYPACLLAIWAMLCAVRRASLRNDALLLGAIVLASAARLELVALLPAALTAVVLVALARPDPGDRRGRAVLRTVSTHRLLFGVAGVAFAGVLARTVANGGNLPLAGRYSSVGSAHANPLRVFELFFQHLAGLDWSVAVIPFAAALLAGYALVRSGYPRSALVFASVAVASVVWLLLEVAFDAAAYDPTSAARNYLGLFDYPRIHERYFIYVMPLFFVALFVVLPLLRKNIPTGRHVAVATIAALLPALIPFSSVINRTIPVESFSLLVFGKGEGSKTVSITHATTLVVALSALLALVYLLAASKRLPPGAAVLTTAAVLLGMSTLELGRQVTTIPQAKLGLPAHADWVDRTSAATGRSASWEPPGCNGTLSGRPPSGTSRSHASTTRATWRSAPTSASSG